MRPPLLPLLRLLALTLLTLVPPAALIAQDPDPETLLTQRLAADPHDDQARRDLLRFYWNAIPANPEQAALIRQKRLDLILWVIANQPDAKYAPDIELIVSPPIEGKNQPLANAADHEQWKHAWLTAAEESRTNAAVQANAGKALMATDPATSSLLLQRAILLDAAQPDYALQLGALYGNTILTTDTFASQAWQALDASLHPSVLRMAAQILKTRATFAAESKTQLQQLADKYLARARALQSDQQYQGGIRPAVSQGADVTTPEKGPQPIEAHRQVRHLRIPAQELAKRVLFHPRPSYPDEAQRNGVSGIARLALVVSPEGAVISVRATDGPFPLQEAAIEAVRNWTYQPMIFNGEAFEVDSIVDIEFKPLTASPAPSPKP